MDILSLLAQRRSTRHFDPDITISEEELTSLLNSAGLSPSSNNSQPWRVVVITKPSLRKILLPIAFHQQQIITASAVLLLLADREAYQPQNLKDIHQEEFEAGCFNNEVRNFLTQAAIDFYQSFNECDTLKGIRLRFRFIRNEFDVGCRISRLANCSYDRLPTKPFASSFFHS